MAGLPEMTRRERVLADFGDFVMDHEDLDEILAESCRLVAHALGAEFAAVVEIDRDTNSGLLRAGLGWRPGVVGRECIGLGERSSQASAIANAEPFVAEDIAREKRFDFPRFLQEHGVSAVVDIPIFLPGRRPWGVLQVAARQPRAFDQDDVEFLKIYAMVLGPVIDRAQIAAAQESVRRGLAQEEERLRGVLDGMGEGFDLLAPDFTILEHNREAMRMDGRPREEIVGRSHWDVYPGSEDSELGRCLKLAMTERRPVTLEHRYAWEEDRALWLEMRAYPTFDGALAVFWRDVTDRIEAEEALRESEARYRSLFESMDEAYAVVEVLKDATGRWIDFRFIEVNTAFVEHTDMPWPVGKTATELLGTPSPRWTELYGQALDSGRAVRVEEAEPTLDRIFDLNIFALDRERNRVAVLFTNITERKKTEAALAASEEKFRTLFDAIDEGLAVVEMIYDQAGEIVDMIYRQTNSAYERLGGVSNVVGRSMFDVIPGVEEHWLTAYKEVARTGVPQRVQNYAQDVDRWFDVYFSRVDETGRFVAIVFNDITDRKRAEVELRDREARYQALFAASPVPFIVVAPNAPDFTITAVNDAYVAATLTTREMLVGRKLLDVFTYDPEHPGRRGSGDVARSIRRVIETRQTDVMERIRYDLVAPNGELEPHWWLAVNAPMLDADGNVLAVIHQATRVTEQYYAEQALRESEGRARLLLAELQHRVRNILAMVRSVVRRTVETGESVEEVGRHLDGRLSSLARTQTLLTRSAGAGVDLETLIREELLAQNADEAGVALDGPSIQLAPKAAEVVTLAIHELATNATKYGAFAHAGASLQVTWTVESGGDSHDWLRLVWQERGVRVLASSPRRTGFGTELIQRRVPYELQGTGEVGLRPGGLRAEIAFPLVAGESILATNLP